MQGISIKFIMRKLILIPILFLYTMNLFSQGSIKGFIKDQNNQPVNGIAVKLIGPKYQKVVNTDSKGNFEFNDIYTGTYGVIISEPEYFEISESVNYIQGEDYKFDDFTLEKILTSKDASIELPTSMIFDDESNNNTSGNNISSLLNASRDPFVSAASFNLSQGGFRMRGYDNFQDIMFINGIPMQNLFRGGDVTYGDFGGLNDVLRSRNTFYGIKAIPFHFGELSTSVDVDAEAINQRKGLRVSGMLTNRNFIGRAMVTYNSGLLRNGLAFSVSGSFRGASEGYVPGTQYESFSIFGSVSKVWNQKLISTLTAFTAKNKRAVQGSSTQEFYELANSNYYNPSWGWQDGQKRSANLRYDFVPNIIFSNEFKPTLNTQINFSLGFQFGEHKNTGLDWYNSYNPNPTYYKKAPSYYKDQPLIAQQLRDSFLANPNLMQIDWQGLYDANQNSTDVLPGMASNLKWARYLMSAQVEKIRNFTANIVLNQRLSNTTEFNMGILFQNSLTEQYRQIDDLLGADYFVNVNQFAERADPLNPVAIQNNILEPNKVLKEGDIYGYHFLGRVTKISSFAQIVSKLDNVDFFIALNADRTFMQRNGYMQNGAYTKKSLGNSEEIGFYNWGTKMGFTYKFDGKNYLGAQVLHTSKNPEFNQVFALPRTTNITTNPANPLITSAEINYNYRGSRIKASATMYMTETKNESNSLTFYTEVSNSFGTLVMNNISKRYKGIELAMEAQLFGGFSTTFVANLGDYSFIRRPKATFYYDNLDKAEPTETVYFHGIHIASGPQNAGMIKLNYNSKQYWSASINLNYFEKIYTEASAQRRTTEAIDAVVPNSDQYYSIVKQEQLPSAFILDASFRKSIYLNKYIKGIKKRMYLDINLSLNNILNNQNYIRAGREQQRFDFAENDPLKFPNRYFYMMGRNYAINVIFRM